jgi:hypothetical protein
MKRILCLMVFLALSVSASMPSSALAAAQSVNVTIPTFNVTLNGTPVDSSSRDYPLIVYRDITYFPMTYHDSRFLGVETEWNSLSTGLFIKTTGIAGAYHAYQDAGKTNSRSYSATIPTFPVHVNGKPIANANEEYPLLVFRDVTYFPMTWRFCHDEFGWEYAFSASQGLVINSVPGEARGNGQPSNGSSGIAVEYEDSVAAVLELVAKAGRFIQDARWVMTTKNGWLGSYEYYTLRYYWLEKEDWFGSAALWSGFAGNFASSGSSAVEKNPEKLDWSFETGVDPYELLMLDLDYWRSWLHGENGLSAPEITITMDDHDNGWIKVKLTERSIAVTRAYEFDFAKGEQGYLNEYTLTESGGSKGAGETTQYAYPATAYLPGAARAAGGY